MIDDRKREEAIFQEALQKGSEAERAAFLEQACRDDPQLRARLEVLLEGHLMAKGFLESTPTRDSAWSSLTPGQVPVSEKPGDLIGRYKLLQQIGEGGCGVVYMAEQAEPVRRMVALKVIKLGMDTKQVIARFEAERQALALMDHPNIAKVLDGGATERGRPFFVMELVRGIKITDYCDQNNLSTTQRLDLFIKVCHAIQHAHQKGIIHRDIKPSNILVTLHDGVPMPKVIDFGVAKATGQRLTDKTLFTAFQQFVGTPAYMSPEQTELSGLDIDTRSDIYALGVLLYELLTGTTPFDPKTLLAAGLEEMRRIIREQEPPRPSTRLSTMLEGDLRVAAKHRQSEPPKLIHFVRGDLDWIVMKALEKDRTRRYETANGMALDIERHLKHEPVSACPPSAVYRFQKLARRHRLVFGATAFVIAALMVCTVTSLSLWRRARLGERRAEWLLYATQMSATQKAWEQDDINTAKDFLADSQRHPDRGFEWYYWQRQVHSDVHTFQGHGKPVRSVAVSPDGSLVATGSDDGTARVWEFSGRRLSLTLTGHVASVRAVAFSPDGKRLATASDDRTARVWDASNGTTLMWLPGLKGPMTCLAFSPDGRYLATGSGVGVTTLWDATNGRELHSHTGHAAQAGAAVSSVAFTPDSQQVLTISWDGTIRQWAISNSQETLNLQGDTGGAWSATFSPDGRFILSDGPDHTARLWTASEGRELRKLTGHRERITSVAFSPDGQRILTGSWDQTARIWETSSGRELLRIKGHAGHIWSVAFSPDGRHAVTGSEDCTAKVWDLNRDRESLLLTGHVGGIQAIAFAPDGQRFVTGGMDQTARLWETLTGRHLATLRGHTGAVNSVAFSPNGRRVLTGSADHMAKVWDAFTSQPLLSPLPQRSPIACVAFSSDGQGIVFAATDLGVRVWPTAGGGELHQTVLPSGKGETIVTLSADGRFALTQDTEQTARIWDVRSGRKICALEFKSPPKPGLASTQDGRVLAVYLIYEIQSAVFSRNSEWLVTGHETGAARVWNAKKGTQLFCLKGHHGATPAVAFSPDGSRIITGGEDRLVKVWDAVTGRELLSLKGHKAGIRCLAVSPDGRQVVSGDWEGSLRVWQAALDSS